MKCFNPIAIDNPDYEISGGNFKVFLPCGKCESCRNNDALQWRVRLKEEFYNSDSALFITLTYDDAFLHFEKCFNNDAFVGFYPTFNKEHIQKFFKRLRRFAEKYSEKKLSYFLVSEYCPTSLRPHYHFLLFNFPKLSEVEQVNDSETKKKIEEIWGLGFITCDRCNEARIGYCTKYMNCYTSIPKWLPNPFRMLSKGLGKCYLSKTNRINWHKSELANYYPDGKHKFKLPRYLKDKIFDDDEKLMIRQLNEERILNEQLEEKELLYDKRKLRNRKESISAYKRKYVQEFNKRNKT